MLRSESDPNRLLFQVAELIATSDALYLSRTGNDDADADYAAAVERAIAANGAVGEDEPEDSPWRTEALHQLVRGSRRVARLLRGLEVEAARQARERGVTVGELASTAGISVRAANDRYRREVFNPAQQPPVTGDPADADPDVLEAPVDGQNRRPRAGERDDQV